MSEQRNGNSNISESPSPAVEYSHPVIGNVINALQIVQNASNLED